MDDIYVVRLGNLYLKEKEAFLFRKYQYTMVDNLGDASFSTDFDYAKKCAEEIGGNIYKVNLAETDK